MTGCAGGDDANGPRRRPRPPEPLRRGDPSPRGAPARAPAGANPMPADGDPPSPDSLELERADHERLVRELVRDPVVGLDFTQADDLEHGLLLIRLEVDRAVDRVLERLEGLVRVPATLQRHDGHGLRLPQPVHEALEEVHRVPLVRLRDRGAEGQEREPEVGILLLELLIELVDDALDVVEIRRTVDPPHVLLLHSLPGGQRRRTINPPHEAELVVLDERREDRRDVLRDVDGQFCRRDDDRRDAFPQPLRDEIQEGDFLSDECRADEEDVRVEGDASIEEVVQSRGAGLDAVRLFLDRDGLCRLRRARGGRDAGLYGALAHLEFLLLLVAAPLEFLLALAQPTLPLFELSLVAEVFHPGRRRGGPRLPGLPFEFEGLEVAVRLPFLEFLLLLEDASVLLVQALDLRLEVALHLDDFPLPAVERLLLSLRLGLARPGSGFFHLRVFEQLRVLFRLAVEAPLGLFDGRGLALDLGGPLAQRRLLIRDFLLSGDELRLPVVERFPLTPQLLFDTGRILAFVAESSLEGLYLDFLLRDLFLFRQDLRFPVFQLPDARRVRAGVGRVDLLAP